MQILRLSLRLLVAVTLTLNSFSLGASSGSTPTQQIRPADRTQSSVNGGRSEKQHPPSVRENVPVKTRAEVLGGTLRRLLRRLKDSDDPRLELVFLVDASTSVGAENFFNEIRFVRKLLSDFTVSSDAVRVALVTFSSRNRILRHIDHLNPNASGSQHHKCSLMQEEFSRINYTGGGTFTLGAMLEAEAILRHARRGVKRVVFLITDGYSNGGDPRPVAQRLKEMRLGRGQRKGTEGGADNKENEEVRRSRRNARNRNKGVEIFTFGIKNGNTEELLAMATDRDHTFIVGSFREFEALGRRAFHQDLQIGSFLMVNSTLCNKLCTLGDNGDGAGENQSQCCDIQGECACGTISGHYSCICPPGHYGTGLKNDCHPCPLGTFNPGGLPGDMHLSCRRCPDPNQTTKRKGATSVDECVCGEGYITSKERGIKCIAITCPSLLPPTNGYFMRTISGKRNARRRLGRASRDKGSNGGNVRRLQPGNRDSCPSLTFKSTCGVRCKPGFILVGSHIRTCASNGNWTGHDASCVLKKCPPLRQPKDGVINCDQKFGSHKGNSSIQLGAKDGFLPNSVCNFECNPGYHLVGSNKRTCLPTGIWDGLQVYCKAKSCPPLQILPHGKVFPPTCAGHQNLSPIVTSCLLVCNPGYVLWGVRDRLEWETNQSKLVCGLEGNWELTNTDIASTREALAWKRGKWNGGRCVDIEPPNLNCPNNISVETDKDKKFATVHWDQPIASDNSGIPVTLNVVPAISWPAKFPIGDNEVTIVARDANRNKAKCKFTITVRDIQPPTVHSCETPPPFVLPSEAILRTEPTNNVPLVAQGLTWDKPSFEDNSECEVRVLVEAQTDGFFESVVWQGLEGGQGNSFPVGDTTVRYTAFDDVGNNNTCEIIISVKEHACPEIPDPINGNSNCSKGRAQDTTSLLCTLTCSEGYAFPVSTPQEYFCSPQMEMMLGNMATAGGFESDVISNGHALEPSGVAMAIRVAGENDYISWEPKEILPFADCMVAAIPNTLQQDGLIFMDGDNSICNDSLFFQQVEDNVRKKISKKLAEICGTGSIGLQCEIVGDIDQVCESLLTTVEEEVNVVMASSVPRDDGEIHGNNKVKGGGKARKGRRNGPDKGLRRKELREEVRGKRKRDGEERRKRGRKGGRKGPRRDGGQRKNSELGDGAKNVEQPPKRGQKPSGVARSPEMRKGELMESTRKRRTAGDESAQESLGSDGGTDDEENNEDYSSEYEDSEEPETKHRGVQIYFKLVGHVKNGSNEAALRQALGRAQKELEDFVSRGGLDLNVTAGNADKNITMKAIKTTIGFGNPHKACNKGSVLVNNFCVKCPTGTYWDEVDEECKVCEKGTYQPLEGQLLCLACLKGFSTRTGSHHRMRRKATSMADCIAECSPGFYSSDGVVPCSSCPKGYFMPLNGATNCNQCPQNKTTTKRGAVDQSSCQDLCQSGTISETGVSPCYPCPMGSLQEDIGKTFCLRNSCSENNCANNSLLAGEDSVSENVEVLPYNYCFTSPCQNGATCIPLAGSGYFCSCTLGFMGTFCEIQEDMCASDPCLNNGNCSSDGNSFTCSCTEEFTGTNCEVMADECTSNPCLNNGICVTEENGFQCLCSSHFEGIRCETPVCHSPPCNVNDMCVFTGEDWQCVCGSNSPEDECTDDELKMLEDKLESDDGEPFEIMPDSVLHFPSSGTTNYILVTGNMDKNYTRVTLCGWMNSKDRSNYGTIFSMATSESDNALVLTDYSGFVIYVGGKSAITDVSANDGKWHHFCFSWASRNGQWQLFLDGILAAKGEDLSPGYAISGQATIVLGQEQDWEGGGFSETESFVGRMTLVTLENSIITAEEAFHRAAFCKSGDRESLIWDWADFLMERQGRLEVEPSPLCKKCAIPSSPKNGHVFTLDKEKHLHRNGSLHGLMVKYNCQSGFTLSKGQEIRRCLSNSTWDGKQPACKRISCDSVDYDTHVGVNKGNVTPQPIKCKGKKKFDNQLKGMNKTEVDDYGDEQNQLENEEHKTPNVNEDLTNSLLKNKTVTNHGLPLFEHNITETEDDIRSEIFNVPRVENSKNLDTETKCIGPMGVVKNNELGTNDSKNLTRGSGGKNTTQIRFLFPFGTKLDVECDGGFHLKGVSHLVCSFGGKWRVRKKNGQLDERDAYGDEEENEEEEEGEETAFPTCDPIKCGSPPDIHQGAWELMERKRWNRGEGLKWFNMERGNISGESEITQDFQTVSSTEETSQSSQTDDKEEEFKFGDIAEYDCEYGYALVGPQVLHCSENGTWVWSGRYPRWPGLEYAPRHYPSHKWPHNNDNPHSPPKFNPTPRSPICLPIRCPSPSPPVNGGFVKRKESSDPTNRNRHLEHPEAYYVGDEILNFCRDEDNVSSKVRKQLIGARMRRCLPSGRWSSYRPRCKDLHSSN